jgi:hypothetical protein
MTHSTKITENEIIDFAMDRLHCFKRIHFNSLTELINTRFFGNWHKCFSTESVSQN